MIERNNESQSPLTYSKKELVNLIYGICMSFGRLKISSFFKNEEMYICFPEGVQNIIKHLESTREDVQKASTDDALNLVYKVAKMKHSEYPKAYEFIFNRALETNLFYEILIKINSSNIEDVYNLLKLNFSQYQSIDIDKTKICGDLERDAHVTAITAFSFAAQHNCINIVKDLLAYDNLSLFDIRWGMKESCYYGRLNIVKLLLNDERLGLKNEDMNIRDKQTYIFNKDFFISAAQSGNINLIKLLIEDGRITFNVSDALIIASTHGFLDLAEYFLANLDKGIRYSIFDTYLDSNTIVQGAAKYGHFEVLKLLCGNKKLTKNYKMLFKITSDNNHLDMAKWLFENYYGHLSDTYDNELSDMNNQQHRLIAKQGADLYSQHVWDKIKSFNRGAGAKAFIQFNIPGEIGGHIGNFIGRYDGIRLSRTCHTIFAAAKKAENEMELEHTVQLKSLVGKL